MTDNNKKGKKTVVRYPWEEWFKRRLFTLLKGRDYLCDTYVMIQQVRNRAGQYNLSISTKVLGGYRGVRVRVFNPLKKHPPHIKGLEMPADDAGDDLSEEE